MGQRTPIGRGEAVTTLLTGATIRWRVATSGSTGTPGDATIKFGWVRITYPNGSGWRQVVWASGRG